MREIVTHWLILLNYHLKKLEINLIILKSIATVELIPLNEPKMVIPAVYREK